MELRCQARNQVDTGLHHRSGVQVGRDRRRRGHGAGQPEVRGGDGGFTQCAGQDEHDGNRDVRGLGEAVESLDLTKRPRARLAAEQDDAHEHGEAAQGGDHERLLRGVTRGGAFAVVAHQEVGQQGGHFPEHVHHQEAIGDDQSIHRGGKADHLGAKHGQTPGSLVEVTPAIEQNQSADAQNDEAKEGRERVHAQIDVEVRVRHPLHGVAQRGTVTEGAGGELVENPEKARAGDNSECAKSRTANKKYEEGRDDGGQHQGTQDSYHS